MKSFLKYLLASILGVLLAGLILILILVAIISAGISSQDKPVEIKSKTILVLNLDKPINDRKSSLPVIVYNLSNLGAENQIGLNDLLSNITKAGKDDNIKGIYLQLSNLQTGIATIEEIRNTLLEFKNTGKFIVAYSENYSQATYYLASVADKLYLNPQGSVNFLGLSAEIMFYKNTLEKLDLEPEIIRHGKFKSAVEPFMLDKMSPENREQISTYVGSIWNHIVKQIAVSRHSSEEKLNAFADHLLFSNTDSVISYNMIDAFLYADQVLDTLAHLVKIDNSKNLNFVTHQKYSKVPKPRDEKGYTRDKIAVIYALGDITSGDPGENYIGSDKMVKTIRDARQDSTVKAIVLRVNSPGGSALASEVIWRELYLAKQVKPVIASMGDVAASGGYYIVSAADTVVASPITITGSIGVYGIMLNAGDFLEHKLGITTDEVNTNKYSDFGSIYRPLSPAERFAMQKMIDETYTTFVKRVSEGRGLSFETVDKIAEGRVWSGSNALDLDLVDMMGGLQTAVEIAAKKAGLDHYRIIELPEIEEPFNQLVKQLTGDLKESFVRQELNDLYKPYRTIKLLLQDDKIQARMPFEITIH
jgi:protease IV